MNTKKAAKLLAQGVSKRDVARKLKCRTSKVYEAFPVTDMDKLRAGMAVMIGRVLAKRCRVCGVTKMLDKFYSDDTASGCASTCMECGHA